MTRVIPRLGLGILVVSLGVCVAKTPHMRLAAQLASGQIDGTAIPVTDFVPACFQGDLVPVRSGNLVFEVPRHAGIELGSPDARIFIRLELAGLKCVIPPPRLVERTDEESPAALPWEAASGEEVIRQRATACRASGQDFSFWMSAADVQCLQDRLDVRPLYWLRAEQVEVVRRESLSGLLLIWTNQGRPCMRFEYLSSDGRTEGDVFMFADGDREQAMRTARALVSTFRLEPVQRDQEVLQDQWRRQH